MRDTGRTACYRAEGDLGEQPQLDWRDLLALAREVVADPLVRAAYPGLVRQPLKLRPRMAWTAHVGLYQPWAHRITLCWGGRDRLTLLHEMAHACTPGAQHGVAWREAFVFLVWRFMGEEMGRRLTAAFLNNQVLQRTVSLVEPDFT